MTTYNEILRKMHKATALLGDAIDNLGDIKPAGIEIEQVKRLSHVLTQLDEAQELFGEVMSRV